jgi:hypothetical protein
MIEKRFVKPGAFAGMIVSIRFEMLDKFVLFYFLFIVKAWSRFWSLIYQEIEVKNDGI